MWKEAVVTTVLKKGDNKIQEVWKSLNSEIKNKATIWDIKPVADKNDDSAGHCRT